jgi:exodeoxyribonuclease-5
MDLAGRFISGEGFLRSERPWEDHVMVIHGYAGTGKTTTVVRAVREHVEDLSRVLFVAPSNKAAAVLRQEGVTARTIHSAFYRVTGEDAETGEPIFMENPINDGQAYTLVVVDEASMVDEDVARWVESQSTRLIVIGDPMQLQPVKGIAHWTAPGREPDYTLTEVVRSRDKVLEEAFRMVRDGTALTEVASLSVDRGCTVDPTRFDVVVTYTNQERVIVNQMFRGEGPPVAGDRIMLLANSSRPSRDFLGPDDYYNGQVLHVRSVIRSSHPSEGVVPHHEVECIDENGMPRRLLILDRWLLTHPSTDSPEAASPARRRIGYRDALPATYAYAITAHKAQGSGWDDVLIVVPGNQSQLRGEEANRWGYTALTRAKKGATIARLDQLTREELPMAC